jgi:Na+/melibiose symporter-like transporter
VNEPTKRPSRLWLLFYGRRRRGFPWLLAGLCAAVLVLALTFAIPGGADAWRAIAPVLLGVLLTVALAGAIVASVWPRRRRP